jgi:CrcB protein
MVALGGAIGSVGRYQTALWCKNWFGIGFPVATLMVNVIGSFIMGLLIAALDKGTLISPYWRPFVAVGILGGFTTFSSFSIDTLILATQGHWGRAALNVLLNVVISLIAVWLGYIMIARHLS